MSHNQPVPSRKWVVLVVAVACIVACVLAKKG
jgi:hypothetical protein